MSSQKIILPKYPEFIYITVHVSTKCHNNWFEDTIYLHLGVVRLGNFTNLLDPWWNAIKLLPIIVSSRSEHENYK